MAATGFTPIQLYRTSTASAVPVNTNLADGELAINLTDEILYFKNAAGTVKFLSANITPVANGGTGATTAGAARTNFGATTLGSNLFTITNPSAVTFPRFNADNTVSSLDAASFRTAIGAGTGGGSVTSVGGTGTVNGISLSGTVTSSGNLTLGGTLSGVSLTTQVTGTLPVTNGGTGQTALSAVSVGTSTNLAGGSNGTIPYQSAAGTTQMLAAGTSGQVLRSNGASAPSWVTPSAGAFNFVSGVTATAASEALLNTGFTSTYDVYDLVVFGVTSANNAAIKIRFEIAGSVVSSASYQYNKGEMTENFPTGGVFTSAGVGTPDTSIPLCNVGSFADDSFNVTIRIYRPSSTTLSKQITWTGTTLRDQVTDLYGNAMNTGTGALTGIQLTPNSGTISCTMRLYGIANS